MTNEMKLLRAFIEASGYEVEEITTEREIVKLGALDTTPYPNKITTIDYKVTKRDNNKLIETMDDVVDIIKGEFGCVDRDILDEFEKAGWVNDEKI